MAKKIQNASVKKKNPKPRRRTQRKREIRRLRRAGLYGDGDGDEMDWDGSELDLDGPDDVGKTEKCHSPDDD